MKIIGHRGARGLAPENTLLSLEKALDAGVDEIEIDVLVTKDSQVILNHDPFIVGADGQKYLIAQHSLEELRRHKADLATLQDAITFVNRRVPLMIEVKRGALLAPIIAIITDFLQHGWQSQDFLVGSFSQKILRALHAALPTIEPVVIARFSGIIARYRAAQVGAHRINLNYHTMWSGYIKATSKSNYQVYPYTLNDPAKAARWEKYGLPGIITDRPDLFVKK